VGGLRHIGRHGEADSAEQLNALRDGIHQVRLFFEMFVEQEMELVEGRTSYLLVRLLVQITKGDRIGKQLVEAFRHFQSHGFFQFEWKYVTDCAVCLNFGSGLVKPRLGADDGMVVRAERFLHKRFSPPWAISIWRARLPWRDRLEETAGCRAIPNSNAERCPHFDTGERPSTLKQGHDSPD
jgi:hypothetical protein